MARGVRDAKKILDHVTGKDPDLREMIAEETLNARVAHMIYETRIRAGLTQAQLADLIGTKQPVIARLEDADYACDLHEQAEEACFEGKESAALGHSLAAKLTDKALGRKILERAGELYRKAARACTTGAQFVQLGTRLRQYGLGRDTLREF